MHKVVLPYFLVIFLLVLGFPPASLKAQSAIARYTISGFVTDAESGERLIGATVMDRRSGQGTVTNTYGFYSLTLEPSDSVEIYVGYIGFESILRLIPLSANQTLHFPIRQSAQLQEVEVTAERGERIEERAQMSRIDVPIEQIKKVPAFLGETDVMRALQLLPGVSGGGEGQSGLYVRGGSPDQNLILLDGVPVYNASHLFGFFSVFNSDAIKDVSLTKGGFPARYGGRLSSVLEINLKEGNENEFHGEGAIGLVASRLTLEGPIQKGRSSFIVSARRTYIDILARPLIKNAFESDGIDGVTGYYFYDINAKINHRFSDRDRLYLSFYTGKDKFYLRTKESYKDDYGNQSYEAEAGLGWGNRTAALRWNHIISPKLFMNTTLTYSYYRFNTKAASNDVFVPADTQIKEESGYSLDYFSGIDDWALKFDFDYAPNPRHLVRYGANAILHTFRPGRFDTRVRETEDNLDISTIIEQPNVQAAETAAYLEDDWKVTSRLRVNYGLHFSSFFPEHSSPYYSLQPRINVRYFVTDRWAVKGAFSTMRQYIHLLTNESIGLPTDLWLPTTAVVKPQDSWQVAAGVSRTFGNDYEFSVEGYYKEMKNVIAFREGSSLFQFSDWQTRVTQGNGYGYGAEFFIQKKKGRFNGWIGYTLAWAWREFEDINFGKRYPYKFDRRHDFEVVGSYKISERVSISGTWVFSTGNAVTLPSSRYDYRDEESFQFVVDHTPERNNYRFKAYHRFDFGIDFTKKKRHHTRTWSFGAYNAYNRSNPFFLFLEETGEFDSNGNYRSETKLKQASLFPIIPYFNYSFKF